MALYLQLTEVINWNYKRSPNYCRGMQNNQCNLPRGKVVGGCSVFNLMIATRSHHKDYDDWVWVGCEGWASNDVFPLFQKMENFEASNPALEPAYHSKGGLLNIELPPYHTRMSGAFLEAGQELSFPLVDYDGSEMIGYSYTYATMKNGSRYSSNRAYLHPVKGRPNLFLTRNSRADRVSAFTFIEFIYGLHWILYSTPKFIGTNKSMVKASIRRIVHETPPSDPRPSAKRSHSVRRRDRFATASNALRYRSRESPPRVQYSGYKILASRSESDGPHILLGTELPGERFGDGRHRELFKVTNTAISDYLGRREGPLTIMGGIESASFLNVDDRSARQGQPNMELIMTGISMGSDPLVHKSLSIVGEQY